MYWYHRPFPSLTYSVKMFKKKDCVIPICQVVQTNWHENQHIRSWFFRAFLPMAKKVTGIVSRNYNPRFFILGSEILISISTVLALIFPLDNIDDLEEGYIMNEQQPFSHKTLPSPASWRGHIVSVLLCSRQKQCLSAFHIHCPRCILDTNWSNGVTNTVVLTHSQLHSLYAIHPPVLA